METFSNMIPAREGMKAVAPDMGAAFDLGDVHFKWKVRSEDSAHHYTVFELTLAPGQGVHLHSHASPETFYVLEGTVDFFRLNGGVLEAIPCGTGTTVNIPPNALHAMFNQSDKRARLLDVSTPAHQAFFDAVSMADKQHAFERLKPKEALLRMMEIASQHDMYLAPYDVRTGIALL
jgi:quercetin dioxygenase-like cupin family protein